MMEKVDKSAQPIFPKEELDHDNVMAKEANMSDFRFMEGKWYVCIAEIVGFTIGKAYQSVEDDSLSTDDDGFLCIRRDIIVVISDLGVLMMQREGMCFILNAATWNLCLSMTRP